MYDKKTKTYIIGGKELYKVANYYNLLQSEVNSSIEKVSCPIHNDVRPSMILDFSDGSYYCFGCNAQGDTLSLIKNIEKLNDYESCKKLAQIEKNTNIKSDIKFNFGNTKTRKFNKELYDQAYDYYHGLKQTSWNELENQDEMIVYEYMYKRGFTIKALNECKAKLSYSYNYPIIFPMFENGKFKGWVSRTNKKSVEDKRKYLYNEGFRRATTLVGNYGNKNYVIVVEGYLDRLKFIQFGETNVVALLGWKASNYHIEKLKQSGITTIVSALDNDEKGREGTKYLENYFKVIKYPYLKELKDSGDMTEKQFKLMHKRLKILLKRNKIRY